MESKKTKKHNLESKRGLFFWMGLTISLLLVISAFEWKSEYDTAILNNPIPVDILEELVQITEQQPPDRPKPKVISPVVIEIDDELEIETPEIIIDLDDITDEELEELIDDILLEEPIETFWSGAVESKPEPISGFKAFYTFIAKNLKYPNKAQKLHIEGKVFVKFVINEFGDITEVEVIKGIGMGCDKEAIRVMNLVPPWTPGKQRGKPVRVKMVLPITFRLN